MGIGEIQTYVVMVLWSFGLKSGLDDGLDLFTRNFFGTFGGLVTFLWKQNGLYITLGFLSISLSSK